MILFNCAGRRAQAAPGRSAQGLPGLKFSPHFHSRSRKASAHGAERAGSEGSCAREKERKSLRSFDVILLFKLLGKRKDSALPCWVFSVGKIMKEWREIRYGLFWPPYSKGSFSSMQACCHGSMNAFSGAGVNAAQGESALCCGSVQPSSFW